MNDRPRRNPLGDPRRGRTLGAKGMAVPFPNDDDGFTLAVLIAELATILTVLAVVGRFDVASRIPAIDLGNMAQSTNRSARHFIGRGLTQLLAKRKGSLVGHA